MNPVIRCLFKQMREQKVNISCVVTVQLISAFVFATQCNLSFSLIRNFKPLYICYSCTALFVYDLVGNLGERFSNDAAQVITAHAIT